jgi:S1-C subfamily serine protease
MTKSGDLAVRRRLALLACLWLALPAVLGAQDPLGTPLEGRRGEQARAEEIRLRAEEMRLRAEEIRERAGELRTHVHALVRGRARLGLMLGEAREAGGRTGVYVNEVVDGGPAARAGIRASDVLLALDGETLGPDPARHLVELMASVEPGDTVSVLLHREGRDHTVRVVTDRSGPMTIRFGERGVPGVVRPGFDPGPALMEALGERGLRMVGPAGRHQLELVEMNPGLGRYFGVTEGVLVANVGDDSSLGLQPGDVLVSIGGRPVRNAAHARSILGSYRADEDLEMEVVRERRTITIRGQTGAGARP